MQPDVIFRKLYHMWMVTAELFEPMEVFLYKYKQPKLNAALSAATVYFASE